MTGRSYVRHFENFFDAMKPAERNDAEAFLWISELPHPCYNILTHLNSDHPESEIDRSLAHLSPYPHSIWLHHENHADDLLSIINSRGYKPLASCPVMVWKVGPVKNANLEVRRSDNPDAFFNILAETSQLTDALKIGLRTLLERVPAEHYLVYLNDRPVGIGTLFIDGDVGVISNVAILKEFQRQGYGTAMMQALMQRSLQLGLKEIILGTSEIAYKLYERLGFKELFVIEMYCN